jgi:CIC family chloride channel protein
MIDEYQIILPLMLAVVISYLIASWLNADSIYTSKLRHLGGMSPLPAARGSVLDLVRVVDAMTPELQSVHPDEPVMELASRFREQNARGFPVLDTQSAFVGLVTATDVQNALIEGTAEEQCAGDVMTAYAVTCTPEESLRQVLQRISDQEVSQVPVVDKTDPSRLLGLLQRDQILWAIGEMASEHSDLLGRDSTLAESRAGSSLEVLVEVRSSHRAISFRRLRQLGLPEQCLVTTLRRGEHTMIPNGSTVIEPGDLLTIVTTPENEPQLRDWVTRLDQG